ARPRGASQLRDSAGFAPDFAVSAPAGEYVPGDPRIARSDRPLADEQPRNDGVEQAQGQPPEQVVVVELDPVDESRLGPARKGERVLRAGGGVGERAYERRDDTGDLTRREPPPCRRPYAGE